MKRMPTLARRIAPGIAAAVLMAGLALLTPAGRSTAETARALPAPLSDAAPSTATEELAVFAGGCFWGVQGVFQHVEGVTNAVSGYAGGDKGSARYDVVSRGATAHAEAVAVTFDPRKISYGALLQVFFSVAHNPTELNRQGPDVGPQYRSVLFPLNAEQARVANAYVAQLDQAKIFKSAIVTKLEPGREFYPAEDYHQDYLTRNPTNPYIVINDLPKIEDLKRLFPQIYRTKPALVAASG